MFFKKNKKLLKFKQEYENFSKLNVNRFVLSEKDWYPCLDDNTEYTVSQIANILIQKIIKTDDFEKWIKYIEDRPFNDKRYYISNQKVKDLGWKICTDFDTGLNEVIAQMSN